MERLKNPFLLVVLAGLLLGISWPPYNFLPGLFVGFVPLLYLIHIKIGTWKTCRFFPWLFLSFAIFNGIAQWWVACIEGVWSAKILGFLSPILVNGLMMSFTVMAFIFIKKKIGNKLTDWSFIFIWCAMEYLHAMDWDLSWPWMFLGNGLADFPWLYQFYEYTGATGGTFFVLWVNLAFYKAFSFWMEKNPQGAKAHLMNGLLKFSGIVIISLILMGKDQQGDEVQVRIVQPNFDPYEEKFDRSYEAEQMKQVYHQSFDNLPAETKLIVYPETVLPYGGWEEEFESNEWYQTLNRGLQNRPDLGLIIGAATYKKVDEPIPSSIPLSYRKMRDGTYYEAFNSTVFATYNEFEIYHKSRLVAGAEAMPFASYLEVLKELALKLGGTSGVLGTQEERTVFQHNEMKICGVICYEADYGTYTTEFIRNGANLLSVITNDAWWQDSPGYQQHLSYARLRAVENRRHVVRSANTGISCIIDQKGNLISPTHFNEKAVVDGKVLLNNELTFYSQFGDIIGRLSLVIVVFFFLMSFMKKYKESVSVLRK